MPTHSHTRQEEGLVALLPKPQPPSLAWADSAQVLPPKSSLNGTPCPHQEEDPNSQSTSMGALWEQPPSTEGEWVSVPSPSLLFPRSTTDPTMLKDGGEGLLTSPKLPCEVLDRI